MKKTALILAIASMIASAVALAHDDDGLREGRRGRRGPTQEAIDACVDVDVGSSCMFEIPRREVEGTCEMLPRGEEAVCMPEHRGRRRAQ